jgi:putative hydrolase of the HAD superfamily
MTQPLISLVVFDLGGVLVRIASSWADAHALAGLPAHSVLASEAFDASVVDALAELQRGAVSVEEFYRRVADASDGAYEPADIEVIHDAWTREQYPGVEAVFDALDVAGVTTAVLSNTSAPHWTRLAALEALAGAEAPEYPVVLRAKHRFASHLIGLLKPDRAVFDLVATTTQTAPEQILFFDDVAAYVAAAREAGWHAEQIDPEGDTARQLLGHLTRYEVISHPS